MLIKCVSEVDDRIKFQPQNIEIEEFDALMQIQSKERQLGYTRSNFWILRHYDPHVISFIEKKYLINDNGQLPAIEPTKLNRYLKNLM